MALQAFIFFCTGFVNGQIWSDIIKMYSANTTNVIKSLMARLVTIFVAPTIVTAKRKFYFFF